METYYINGFVVEVENDNAKPGDMVNVYIHSRNANQYKSCYRLFWYGGDNAIDIAKRAYCHYKMGTRPDGNFMLKPTIIDQDGSERYTMNLDQLQSLYKRFEDFVADCTKQEYTENKSAIIAVLSLIHKHMNAEIYK